MRTSLLIFNYELHVFQIVTDLCIISTLVKTFFPIIVKLKKYGEKSKFPTGKLALWLYK